MSINVTSFSEIKNKIAFTTSSAFASLFIGTSFIYLFINILSFLLSAVSIPPGDTLLTLIFLSLKYLAKYFVI